jgi:hypothetical protein
MRPQLLLNRQEVLMQRPIQRKRAAMAVIERALAKALVQLTLAHATARICDDAVFGELQDLVQKTTDLRKRVGQTAPSAIHSTRGNDDALS